jgi:hypothetical protein
MVARFFIITFMLCLAPFAMLASIATFLLCLIISILWLLIGILFFIVGLGSIIGFFFVSTIGLEILDNLWESDFLELGLQISQGIWLLWYNKFEEILYYNSQEQLY